MKAETLKKSILQLAVEGKLVPQIESEEPASVLLEKMREEKEQLIKDKKIKRDKNESVIYRENGHFYEKVGKKEPVCIDDEIPFDIPDSWEWVRLNDIGIYKKGPFGSALTKSIFVPKGKDTVKVYEQKNAIKKDSNLGYYYITLKYYKEKMQSFTVRPGDIIVSCAGTIGETYVMPDNIELGIINQALMKMEIYKSINQDFFLLYFDYILKEFAKKKSNGSAMKNIPPFKIFKKMLFPTPPISEQHRIVKRIEEILPHIEEYNLAEQELTKLNQEFPEKMKKSILQYAVEGKLVPQLESEEPASVLLEKIREEKEQLIKDKKIKRDKNESVIYRENGHFYEKVGKKEPICIDDEIPFDIPDSWEWVRLGDVFEIVMGQSPEGKSVLENVNLDSYLEFHQGKTYFGEKIILKSDKSTNAPKKIAEPDSVLLCVRAPVGIVNILNRKICIGRGLCSIKSYLEYFPVEYIYYSMSVYEKILIKKSTGTTFKAISKKVVTDLLFPLPPLAEQHRIVKRIEEILPLIENL